MATSCLSGPYAPDHGQWFDPPNSFSTLRHNDRPPFQNHPRLFTFGEDTAAVMPKAVVSEALIVTKEAPASPAPA